MKKVIERKRERDRQTDRDGDLYVLADFSMISFTDYEKGEEFGKTYASTTGPGTTCRPHEHLFYRKLGPVVRRTLEKCNRENGFM